MRLGGRELGQFSNRPCDALVDSARDGRAFAAFLSSTQVMKEGIPQWRMTEATLFAP